MIIQKSTVPNRCREQIEQKQNKKSPHFLRAFLLLKQDLNLRPPD